MPASPFTDIPVITKSHALPLTDERHQPFAYSAYGPDQREPRLELQAQGLTIDAVRDQMLRFGKIDYDENAHLVYVQPAPGGPHESIEDGLRLVVMHWFNHRHIPFISALRESSDPEVIEAWCRHLCEIAPAIDGAIRSIHEEFPDAEIEVFLELAGGMGAYLNAHLPLNAAQHHRAISDIFAGMDATIPPSNHKLIEAAARLRWRYDPNDIPSAAFDSRFRSLPF